MKKTKTIYKWPQPSSPFNEKVINFLYVIILNCDANCPPELSSMTALFAKSAAMLGTAEEHTALSRALSQLAETEERIETVHADQSDHDFFIMAELCKDYVALLGAVKVGLFPIPCPAPCLFHWSLIYIF